MGSTLPEAPVACGMHSTLLQLKAPETETGCGCCAVVCVCNSNMQSQALDYHDPSIRVTEPADTMQLACTRSP